MPRRLCADCRRHQHPATCPSTCPNRSRWWSPSTAPHDCRCPGVRYTDPGGVPAWVSAPVQYGKRICAFVLYLLHCPLLPEQHLAALVADLFDVPLATATIARIGQDCAVRFQGFAEAVRDHVATAVVKHTDETGLRIGGKKQWLHIASTALPHLLPCQPRSTAACWRTSQPLSCMTIGSRTTP